MKNNHRFFISNLGKNSCTSPGIISLILLLVNLLFFNIGLQAQEQEKLIETLEVENLEIAIRVFDSNQLVPDLKKEDFQLLIDGKDIPINSFYEVRKKLEDNSTITEKTQLQKESRLFVLIFNLTDYHQDLHPIIDVLFDKIFRRSDRLIVITNHYLFPEWSIQAIEGIKTKIKGILNKELEKMRLEMTSLELELKAQASMLKSRIEDLDNSENTSPEDYFTVVREFLLNYQFILEDIKGHYLSIPLEQYIKIARYLKGQHCEKWVLNFYQVGRLPLLNLFGEIQQQIQALMGDASGHVQLPSEAGGPELKREFRAIYNEFTNNLQKSNEILMKDIGKAFLNSGATFYTQLMKPVTMDFSPDFQYKTVTTDPEIILNELSRLTGGKVVNTNRAGDFIKSIVQQEDIIYMMSFVPPKKIEANAPIDIKHHNRDLRVVFDDQKRMKSYREVLKELSQNQENIEIENLALASGNILMVKLKNIELVNFEGEEYGAVKIRIKILDNEKKMVKGFERVFKGVKVEGAIKVPLPQLPLGKYKLVVEVKDLFSLRDVYAGDAISLINKGITPIAVTDE